MTDPALAAAIEKPLTPSVRAQVKAAVESWMADCGTAVLWPEDRPTDRELIIWLNVLLGLADLFGNDPKGMSGWLNRPHRMCGGQAPALWLASGDESKIVIVQEALNHARGIY